MGVPAITNNMPCWGDKWYLFIPDIKASKTKVHRKELVKSLPKEFEFLDLMRP